MPTECGAFFWCFFGEAQRARVGLALQSCGVIRRTIEKNVGVLLEVVEGGRGEDTYLTFIIVDIMVDGGGGVDKTRRS